MRKQDRVTTLEIPALRTSRERIAELERQVAEAKTDGERLDWLDKKDRSAHQDGTHWSIWIDTEVDSDPLVVEGDLRAAIDAARKERA